MKKALKFSVALAVILFTVSSICMAQDEVKIKRSKLLFFKGESQKAEVKVKSTKEYNYLVLKLHCQLTEGNVTINIFDPEGKKQGTFTIKTDEPPVIGENTQSQQKVSGQMSKVFGKPLTGDWILKATPSSAVGNLSIDITQGFEPKIDMINIQTLKSQ